MAEVLVSLAILLCIASYLAQCGATFRLLECNQWEQEEVIALAEAVFSGVVTEANGYETRRDGNYLMILAPSGKEYVFYYREESPL